MTLTWHPRPDPRLAAIGASVLKASIDAAQDQIPIEKPRLLSKENHNEHRADW